MYKNNHGYNWEDEFGCELCICQSIEGEEGIEDEKGRDLQNHLPEDRKNQCFLSHAGGLENAYSNEVHTEEGKPQAEATQEACSIGDNGLILDE